MIKLNLGCRDRPFPTYINIDIDPNNPYADVIDNAFELNTIEDNSVDLIEAIHMFEHLSYLEANQALSIWFKKLKKGGILRLAVPDIKKGAALLLLTNNLNPVKTMFSGSQRDQWDFHKSTYTKESLMQKMVAASFINIQEWDWRTTWPHNYIDTYASTYWPPMRKNYLCNNGEEVDLGGICISLNIEGTK